MKLILFSVLICLPAWAQKPLKKELTFTQAMCKQKILPLKVEYLFAPPELQIKITAETALKSLEVKGAVGLSGLTVKRLEAPAVQDLPAGSSVQALSEIIPGDGRSYLSLTVEATVGAEKKAQVIVIPFGEISERQRARNSQNVKLERVRGKNGSAFERKIHVLPLQTKRSN